MGCPASRQTIPHEKDHQFVILVKRISIQFQQESSRLAVTLKNIKSSLNAELNKPVEGRSKANQYSLLSELTAKSHLKAIYQYLGLQCKIILDRQRFVPILFSQTIGNKQQAQEKLSIKKPIQTLLFSLSILNDGRESIKDIDLSKFERTVTTKFRDIKEPLNVENELINYYKKCTIPNEEMIKQTAFQLCQEANISISKFQEVGNNFKY